MEKLKAINNGYILSEEEAQEVVNILAWAIDSDNLDLIERPDHEEVLEKIIEKLGGRF